jgi:hypothetical protein
MWSGLVEPRHPPAAANESSGTTLPPGCSPVAGPPTVGFFNAPACSDVDGHQERRARDSRSMECSDQLRPRCWLPACHRVAHPASSCEPSISAATTCEVRVPGVIINRFPTRQTGNCGAKRSISAYGHPSCCVQSDEVDSWPSRDGCGPHRNK